MPPTNFRPGTEVVVRKILDFESGPEGEKHAYTIALAHIESGPSQGKEYYFDADSVVRFVQGPASTGPRPASKSAPPKIKKRRYASQEAQRQLNMQMLNQGVQQSLINGAESQAAQYRMMTPQRSQRLQGPSHYCGAPTLDGTPCMRLVDGYGYCYQHR